VYRLGELLVIEHALTPAARRRRAKPSASARPAIVEPASMLRSRMPSIRPT